MYFVCIKFAKFIHNLIPVYNNLVVQGSGLFYFGIFVCVCWSLFSSFSPSFSPSVLFVFIQHVTKLY